MGRRVRFVRRLALSRAGRRSAANYELPAVLLITDVTGDSARRFQFRVQQRHRIVVDCQALHLGDLS